MGEYPPVPGVPNTEMTDYSRVPDVPNAELTEYSRIHMGGTERGNDILNYRVAGVQKLKVLASFQSTKS